MAAIARENIIVIIVIIIRFSHAVRASVRVRVRTETEVLLFAVNLHDRYLLGSWTHADWSRLILDKVCMTPKLQTNLIVRATLSITSYEDGKL